MSPVPGELAAAAFRRDLGACVCCGTSVTARTHSARRRSPDGGDGLANLLTFLGDGSRPGDPDDHRARVDSRRDPDDEAKGYTVRSRDDPALVPVTVFSPRESGVTLWLTDDGEYLTVPPEGAEAA